MCWKEAEKEARPTRWLRWHNWDTHGASRHSKQKHDSALNAPLLSPASLVACSPFGAVQVQYSSLSELFWLKKIQRCYKNERNCMSMGWSLQETSFTLVMRCTVDIKIFDYSHFSCLLISCTVLHFMSSFTCCNLSCKTFFSITQISSCY